jgi:hypothetical protein
MTIKEHNLDDLKIKLSSTNEITKLKQKEVSSSHKTLGTYKCIVGVQDKQYLQLQGKSDKISGLMTQSQLNRQQSWVDYNYYYLPTMTYSLTAVSMNESQLTNIQQRATTQFIRKCGYKMTFPKAIVHGPKAFGRLGFQHLYVESNIQKIKSVFCHINKNTNLGEIVRLNLNWVQLHMGIATPILKNMRFPVYIQKHWFQEIQKILIKKNATIDVNLIWKPRKPRANEMLIMDSTKLLNKTKKEQQLINNWRIYFQLNSISEITNYTGNQRNKKFLVQLLAINYTTKSQLRWPIQKCLVSTHSKPG